MEMSSYQHIPVAEALEALDELAGTPAQGIARGISELMAPLIPHEGLVVLAADTKGGARFDTGHQDIIEHIPFLLLDQIRGEGRPGTTRTLTVEVNGSRVSTLVILARNGALLMLILPSDPTSRSGAAGQEGQLAAPAVSMALHLWNIAALKVQEPADAAAPPYLQQARVSSGVRMEALTELADEYSTTLESALAALRSEALDDRTARQTATHMAAKGLVLLRTASDRVRTVTEEPVTTAFAQLRDDLRPLMRYRPIDVQFVEPPVDGRPLPSEVAHGARAVVRSLILDLVDHPSVTRIRVQWDCDGTNLIIDMRDDGPGDLTDESLSLQLARRRIYALYGRIDLHGTPGWGTEMTVVIPLDPPTPRTATSQSWNLSSREQEVLELVASGLRNREIATRLKISENTVKFHLARTYRKQGVRSRAEATALYLAHSAPSQ